MNDSQILQTIRSEIHKTSQSNKFNVSSIQRHIHNDLDAPYVFQPILTYVGRVNSDGTVALLPVGWTVTALGSGEYLIRHNLNTYLYSVTFASQNLNTLVAPSLLMEKDDFDVTWNTTEIPTGTDSSFCFILTNIDNKSTKIPRYYGTLTQ